jgi:hypothetical protein
MKVQRLLTICLLLGVVFGLVNILPTAFAHTATPSLGGWVFQEGDSDGDGVVDDEDNCPNVANEDQADTWGSDAGDACDTDFYTGENGVTAYVMHDGNLQVWANCGENGESVLVAEFDPATLDPDEEPTFQADTANGCSVTVYFLGEDEEGNNIFQVNTYDSAGVLLDDGLELNVSTDWGINDDGEDDGDDDGEDDDDGDDDGGDDDDGDDDGGDDDDGDDDGEDDGGEAKVTICHIPPGNPDNPHTITVGESAVDAHLAHGDYEGPCEEDDDGDDGEDDGTDDDGTDDGGTTDGGTTDGGTDTGGTDGGTDTGGTTA